MEKQSTHRVDSTLSKGLSILETLAVSREGMGVTELSKRLDLTKSNTFRLLQSLATLGYVRQNADKTSESALWQCTPGTWRLSIPSDELCHFIAGRATYTSDDGEVIEVRPGTVVHFLAGWTGQCVVHETIRNVFMLR